jgi:hypothetical protein
MHIKIGQHSYLKLKFMQTDANICNWHQSYIQEQ